jgi:hypothetical protein
VFLGVSAACVFAVFASMRSVAVRAVGVMRSLFMTSSFVRPRRGGEQVRCDVVLRLDDALLLFLTSCFLLGERD